MFEGRYWVTLLKRTAVIVSMVIAFFPIYWLIATSFKPFDEWASWPPVWLTDAPTLQNYRIVFFSKSKRRTRYTLYIIAAMRRPHSIPLRSRMR